MEGTLARGLALGVAGPFPGGALVVGEGERERVAAARRVVINEGPVAVRQAGRVVGRGAQSDAPVRAVVAHEGDDRTDLLADEARLDVAEPDQRPARSPGRPA